MEAGADLAAGQKAAPQCGRVDDTVADEHLRAPIGHPALVGARSAQRTDRVVVRSVSVDMPTTANELMARALRLWSGVRPRNGLQQRAILLGDQIMMFGMAQNVVRSDLAARSDSGFGRANQFQNPVDERRGDSAFTPRFSDRGEQQHDAPLIAPIRLPADDLPVQLRLEPIRIGTIARSSGANHLGSIASWRPSTSDRSCVEPSRSRANPWTNRPHMRCYAMRLLRTD